MISNAVKVLLIRSFRTDGCSQVRRRTSEEEAIRRSTLPPASAVLGGKLTPPSAQHIVKLGGTLWLSMSCP